MLMRFVMKGFEAKFRNECLASQLNYTVRAKRRTHDLSVLSFTHWLFECKGSPTSQYV